MLLIALGFTAIAAANEPPSLPTIDGPTSGQANEDHDYTFTSTDADGDEIFYTIEWGCGESEVTDPHPSGVGVTAAHGYTEGDYTIRAKATDSNQSESGWATLEITMPKKKVTQMPFLNFLEQYPNMFPILRILIQLIRA